MPPTLATPPHSFHVPVMGTGFSLDTALRVAQFGISSVISLVDDKLIEQVHAHYRARAGETLTPIADDEPDARARRITAYLDFVDARVREQVARLRAQPFVPGSDIVRYFELLPDGPLRAAYERAMAETDPSARRRLEDELRGEIVAGSIDANIMTKLDRDTDARGEARPAGESDALAALRGFAHSTVNGAIVFSAGMNPRLYGYAAEFEDFLPRADATFRKRIVLKVSDYRSAKIQGKFFAKRGLWISEYRIESGLNCGGHAFPSESQLLGPALAEFRDERDELRAELFEIYCKALRERRTMPPSGPPAMRVTVQGGIGNSAEDALLREHFGVDGTGWGTPFLLVPEVTNVDDETRRRLMAATPQDVQLSHASPLGIRFWNLMTSPSEDARRLRIEKGHPGSPCPKGYLKFDTTSAKVPTCLASRANQKLRLAVLDEAPSPTDRERTLSKSCICHDLAGTIEQILGIDDGATPAICPGPNIVNFNRIASLEEMVGHIYGRNDLLARRDRPHMLIAELRLYVEHLRDEIDDVAAGRSSRKPASVAKLHKNILEAVDFYAALAREHELGERFAHDLARLREEAGAIDPAGALAQPA